VYNNTLATVKRQIQQAEKPTPAVVISVKAVRVDNAILLDYLTSKVALEEPQIGSTEPNFPIDNNCTDDQLHFGMPGLSGDYKDDADGSDMRNAIPAACRRQRSVTDLERFYLATSDLNAYESEDGDDAYADEEDEAFQADDGSTQNVEDWGHSRFDLGASDVDGYECEDGHDAYADEEE